MKDYYSEDELFEDWIYDLRIPGACRECGAEVAYEGDDDWYCRECGAQQKTTELAIPKNKLKDIIDGWYQDYKNSSNPEEEADQRFDEAINRDLLESQQSIQESQQKLDEYNRMIQDTNRKITENEKQNSRYTFKKFLWEGIPVFIVVAAVILYFVKPEIYTNGMDKIDTFFGDLRDGSVDLTETKNDYNVPDKFYEDYFDKTIGDLTENDYEKIKYVRLYNYNCRLFIEASEHLSSDYQSRAEFEDTIFYWEEDKETADSNIDSDRVCDLSKLTGLEQIEYRKLHLEPIIFPEKSSIHSVTTDESIEEISSKFDPSKITELDLEGNGTNVLAGIEQFTNLKTLIVYGSSGLSEGECYDISYLASCKDLEVLHLNTKLSQNGFQTLSELDKLKSLCVEGLDLKDCSLLQNTPEMEDITIESISDPAGYKYLKNLSNLKKLTIMQSISLENISEFKGIENLNVRVDNISNLGVLKEMPALKRLCLYINDWNEEFGDYSPADISVLGDIPELTECELHLCGLCMGGICGAENLLNKKGLSKLAIIQNTCMPCPILVEQDKLETNNDLIMLDIREIEFRDADSQDIPVSSIVVHFPSLIRLNLLDENVDDLSFLADSKIEVLGIEDNNIKDASPLSNMKSLKKVYIGGNDILIDDCPDGVEVIADDYFDFFHDNETIFD